MLNRLNCGPLITVTLLSLVGCAGPRSMAERVREFEWMACDAATSSSLRGVTAPDLQTCWISGADGTVRRTLDGGGSWTAFELPDGAECDYRSIDAVNANQVWLATAGTPVRIEMTEDGGTTWVREFESDDPAIFFNALRIAGNGSVFAFSDPSSSAMLIYARDNKSGAWHSIADAIAPREGEHGYAASGSALAVGNGNHLRVGFGGGNTGTARILISDDGGATWSSAETPLAASESAGIFSLAFSDAARGVALGGDYLAPDIPAGTAAFTRSGGVRWQLAKSPPRGYRSSVVVLPGFDGNVYLATGTNGTDATVDGGRTWFAVTDEGWNALAVAGITDHAVVGWAVGSMGRVARWRIPLTLW